MGATEEFFQAVKTGQLAKVEELLEREPTLLAARSPKGGLSPVVVAVYYGQKGVLEALLRHGPMLDVHEAALVGDAGRVRALVEQAPDTLNAISKDGFPPLGLAAYMGRADVVRYLLDRGADTEYANPETGFTALTGAVSNGHEDVVRLLLERGANVNYHYEGGKLTPLHAAIMEGKVGIARLLLKHGADANARMDDGKSALALAEGKDAAIADLLREHGARA
jgi:ankyrin repeat protein